MAAVVAPAMVVEPTSIVATTNAGPKLAGTDTRLRLWSYRRQRSQNHPESKLAMVLTLPTAQSQGLMGWPGPTKRPLLRSAACFKAVDTAVINDALLPSCSLPPKLESFLPGHSPLVCTRTKSTRVQLLLLQEPRIGDSGTTCSLGANCLATLPKPYCREQRPLKCQLVTVPSREQQRPQGRRL